MSVDVQRETRRVVTKHRGHRFHVHAVLQGHGCEGVAEIMKAPASGGTAFDRAKAARKRARAAPVTHFIAGSRQNDCTRCAKKYPPFFVAAFDLTFVYVRLAAAPVGVQFFCSDCCTGSAAAAERKEKHAKSFRRKIKHTVAEMVI